MSKTLTISYNLHPPPDTVVPESHPTSKSCQFTVPASDSQQKFYEALRDAVIQAKMQIGADLTVWRDAVGALENTKEPKRVKKDSDEEDEEVEEEEEEA